MAKKVTVLKIGHIDNFYYSKILNQNYRDKIMQILIMRYNLKFRKLTPYVLTRPQSIRKSNQISGQTILSSPQDLAFHPNFAKIATFQWLKIALHGPSRQWLTDRFTQRQKVAWNSSDCFESFSPLNKTLCERIFRRGRTKGMILWTCLIAA